MMVQINETKPINIICVYDCLCLCLSMICSLLSTLPARNEWPWPCHQRLSRSQKQHPWKGQQPRPKQKQRPRQNRTPRMEKQRRWRKERRGRGQLLHRSASQQGSPKQSCKKNFTLHLAGKFTVWVIGSILILVVNLILEFKVYSTAWKAAQAAGRSSEERREAAQRAREMQLWWIWVVLLWNVWIPIYCFFCFLRWISGIFLRAQVPENGSCTLQQFLVDASRRGRDENSVLQAMVSIIKPSHPKRSQTSKEPLAKWKGATYKWKRFREKLALWGFVLSRLCLASIQPVSLSLKNHDTTDSSLQNPKSLTRPTRHLDLQQRPPAEP